MKASKKKLDPYKELGVGRKASPDEIKAAYRRRAKQAHPDTGGSREEFAAVRQSYMVLADPARRTRYDETGESEESNPDNRDQGALAVISNILSAILVDDQDPFGVDLVKVMTDHLAKEIAQIDDKLKQFQRALKRAGKMAKRFKRKAGENELAGLLGWQKEQLAVVISQHEFQRSARIRAKEIISDHTFDANKAAARVVMPWSMSAATASTW